MISIQLQNYERIVIFTGAGMSAESGVPTYRGRGGIWQQYRWQQYACQTAFDRDPPKVLEFHEVRRQAVLACPVHAGHVRLAELEKAHPNLVIVTQNIDGLHQRAGSRRVIELHGSLWRLRCAAHGVFEDIGETYRNTTCEKCGWWLRPDIIWFEDSLNAAVIEEATDIIGRCDLFVGIGTSGLVWPAAGFPQIAKAGRARCVEINPEPTEMSSLYEEKIRGPAGKVLPTLFPLDA